MSDTSVGPHETLLAPKRPSEVVLSLKQFTDAHTETQDTPGDDKPDKKEVRRESRDRDERILALMAPLPNYPAPEKSPSPNTRAKRLSISKSGKTCRLCKMSDTPNMQIITPCECTGSRQFAHKECLMRWLNTHYMGRCQTCLKLFKIERSKFVQLSNLKCPPMTIIKKLKYVAMLFVHIAVLGLMVWADYWLIFQGLRSEKIPTPEWFRLAIVIVLNIFFVCIIVHQSGYYTRLYGWWSFFNKPITNIYDRNENTTHFSVRDNLPSSIYTS